MLAVLAVVQKGHAVAVLREVDKAVRGHLELRFLPGSVAVRGAPDHAVGALESGVIGADRQWKTRLQQRAPLMPIDVGLDVEPRGVCPEADGLNDLAVA